METGLCFRRLPELALGEGLFEIGNDVLFVLNAEGEADEVVGDASGDLLFGG